MVLVPPKRLFHVPSMSTVMYADVVDDVEEKGYVAVSHVWGDQKMYEPKKLGIIEGVDWKIPLSNRDKMMRLKTAMEFLKKEYCWWDILCMPQDRQNVINQEIPLMGDYYAGADMTFVLSDQEYNASKNLKTWLDITWTTAMENRSLTLEEHEWMSNCKENLLDISKDQWFNRVWTLQEASLSKKLILMGTNHVYIMLSEIIVPISRAMDKGDMRITEQFRDVHKFVIMGFNCAENLRYLATIMQAIISRDCYRPQDRFYGVLGVLGYKDFPVDYDISMDDLNRKIIQYACSKGDMSWLTVTGYDIDGFIPLLHVNFTYGASTWVTDSPDICNVLFEDGDFCINVAEYGKIVDCKYFSDRDTDELECIQEGILTLRDWDLDAADIIYLISQFKDIPGEVLGMIEMCVNGIFKGYTFETVRQGFATVFGYGSAKYIYHMQLCMKSLVMVNNRTIAKVLLNGDELLLALQGKPGIGDRVMLTKVHNLSDRQLGIVVDNRGRRKGVYRIKETNVQDERYVRHKFPL